MEKEWHLELPKLVISVTGGNKNFDMHSHLKLVFQEGLLKVSLSSVHIKQPSHFNPIHSCFLDHVHFEPNLLTVTSTGGTHDLFV